MRWVTSRLQARSYWKRDTPSPLVWNQHVDAMQRLLSAVALLDGSSQNQVRWALSRVVWYTGCVIFGRRGTVDFSWREHGQSYRRIATGSNVHDASCPGCTLSSRGDLLRGRESGHGKRFRLAGQEGDGESDPTETDTFFFFTRGRRLFTEVLVPDGIASGLAQVGLFMGDKNTPDEFGIVFQGAIDNLQENVTKENGGIFGPIRGKGALLRGHAIRRRRI